jgi:methyl-accepting chemotaxis protein
MHHARLNIAMAAALGLAVAFAVSLIVSRSLVRPILEVQTAARRIGEGDLTARLESHRSDEIGDTVRAFEEMTASLGATIRLVTTAADRVEETSDAIAKGTARFLSVTQEQQRSNDEAASTLSEIESLVERIAKSAFDSSQGLDLAVDGSTASFRELADSGNELRTSASGLVQQTDEITASLERVVASAVQVAGDTETLLPAAEAAARSVGEVAQAARSLSDNAEQTARLSGGVVETAERGRRIVRNAVEGMEATRQTIQESERVIQSLSQRAEEIGTMVTVIDEVSDETNLLALNAAIIAAQAGESGRAFAVVADEMKAVCERVQASTRKIENVVQAVQRESANAVESIARGSARANEGALLIQQAETTLAEITTAARESGDRMTESAVSTAQQEAAAAAVVEQMEAVREGVGRIRAFARAQVQANEVFQRSSATLRRVAQEVQSTVDVQTSGTDRIGRSVEEVQRAVREITQGLEEQGTASHQVTEVVRRSIEYTRSHEGSAAEMASASSDLARQAEALREAVRRFRV